MFANLELIYSSVAFLVIIFLLKNIVTSVFNSKKNLPPRPPSLPILGHLHLFKPPLHLALTGLAQKYGPIFSLQLGTRPALVVSSPLTAEECLAQNDIVFANRPNLLSSLHAYNNTLLIWAPYGPHWRNLRRITTLLALSTKRIEQATPTRVAEMRAMVRDLIRSSENLGGTQKEVNLRLIFSKLARNLVMRMLNGKEWEHPLIISPAPMIMTICDFVPVLRWIGYKGIEKGIIKHDKGRDKFLQKLVDDCRESRAIRRAGGVQGHKEEEEMKKTLIEELLDLQEVEPDYYTDYTIKGIILVMIVGGSDTSARTLESAMSLLLDHPEVLEKARTTIDTHVKKNQLVDDSDLPKLTYIRWIINETLRLNPPTPFLLPHYSSSDCIVGGYHVPKGTMLFINAWGLHRDPTLWEEPDKFNPDRFEHEREQGSFKYMPFGIGRRSCPGSNLALRNLTLALATVIQCFQWEKGEFQRGGSSGVMLEPFHAICRPRSFVMDNVL